jgi:hypothetical protein
LLVTLAISAALLLVLARFRFPQPDQSPPASTAPPLERLAARATYDQLALTMADVERRIAPWMLVLDVQAATAGSMPPEPATRATPALRIREDMALVRLLPGERVVRVRGQPQHSPTIVGRDDVLELAVVPVRAASLGTLSIAQQSLESAPPGYAALVEASRSGPTLRPIFLSRSDPIADLRWQQPLVSLGGGLAAPAGSFVFTLEGTLLGLVTSEASLPALVPAALVLSRASELAQGRSRRRGDFGIRWQRLTPRLAKATGASTGVVVGGVLDGGPAATLLAPGDVVQSIDKRQVASLSDAVAAEAVTVPGQAASIAARRGTESVDVAVVAREATEAAAAAPGASEVLGLVLRRTREGVSVVRVDAGSAADLAGVVAGDVITHVNREPLEAADVLPRRWAQAESGSAFLLALRRPGVVLAVALEKP